MTNTINVMNTATEASTGYPDPMQGFSNLTLLTFCTGQLLVVGGCTACIVGRLAAPLASACYMPVAPPQW